MLDKIDVSHCEFLWCKFSHEHFDLLSIFFLAKSTQSVVFRIWNLYLIIE